MSRCKSLFFIKPENFQYKFEQPSFLASKFLTDSDKDEFKQYVDHIKELLRKPISQDRVNLFKDLEGTKAIFFLSFLSNASLNTNLMRQRLDLYNVPKSIERCRNLMKDLGINSDSCNRALNFISQEPDALQWNEYLKRAIFSNLLTEYDYFNVKINPKINSKFEEVDKKNEYKKVIGMTATVKFSVDVGQKKYKLKDEDIKNSKTSKAWDVGKMHGFFDIEMTYDDMLYRINYKKNHCYLGFDDENQAKPKNDLDKETAYLKAMLNTSFLEQVNHVSLLENPANIHDDQFIQSMTQHKPKCTPDFSEAVNVSYVRAQNYKDRKFTVYFNLFYAVFALALSIVFMMVAKNQYGSILAKEIWGNLAFFTFTSILGSMSIALGGFNKINNYYRSSGSLVKWSTRSYPVLVGLQLILIGFFNYYQLNKVARAIILFSHLTTTSIYGLWGFGGVIMNYGYLKSCLSRYFSTDQFLSKGNMNVIAKHVSKTSEEVQRELLDCMGLDHKTINEIQKKNKIANKYEPKQP